MKVILNYFKQSGKWYSEAEYETELTPEDPLYNVWDELEEMFQKGKRPGLVDGTQEFNTLVEVPEHPHNHLHIIMIKLDIKQQYETTMNNFIDLFQQACQQKE